MGSVKPDQLCWYCSKACGRCSWSAKSIPVAGWTASDAYVNGIGSTYRVTDCPQFDRDCEPDMMDQAISTLLVDQWRQEQYQQLQQYFCLMEDLQDE